MQRCTLIFNEAAGTAEHDELEQVRSCLSRFDFEARPVREGQDPREQARAALAERGGIIVAFGGDGTVSAVADVLASPEATERHDVAMGIIPRGTANSVATCLGIPSAVDEACRVIDECHSRVIDTARLSSAEGERSMVLIATLGIHAESVAGVDKDFKKMLGPFAYALEEVRHLLGDELFQVELRTPDFQWQGNANGVTVANLAPRSNLLAQGTGTILADDGLLDVTIVAIDGAADAVSTTAHLATRAWSGEASEHPNVLGFRVTQLQIGTVEPMRVMVDGDFVATTPLSVAVWPQSLRVLVPETED